MIRFVWQLLPGPHAIRLVILVGVLIAIAATLWYGVFPLLSDLIPLGEPTVG